MGKTRDLFRKVEVPKKHFMKDGLDKGQNELCSFPKQTIQYHGDPSLFPNQ